MKNILILADGVLAKHFITRLASSKIGLYHYVLISCDERISKTELNKDRFSLHEFDPTSLSKFKFATEKMSFKQAIIVMSNKRDSYACYENIRASFAELEIVLLSLWSLSEYSDLLDEDQRLDVIDGKNTLTTRLVDSLPDMPVFADNIGLGEGEIMEVRVPSGSAYAYRSIGSIQQRKWRIALIIRAGALVLPSNAEKIQPGDSLIAVGDPNVLENVFRAIKRDGAQFPNPFGSNIYCIIDMLLLCEDEVSRLIQSALFLHFKLANRRLFFKVLNPTLSPSYYLLRDLEEAGVEVIFSFDEPSFEDISGDVANLSAGLVLVGDRYFFKFKAKLYDLKLPVLKLGLSSLAQIKDGVVVSADSEEFKSHWAVIMDLCAQLGFLAQLFAPAANSELLAYFDGLSRLFDNGVKINLYTDENPILSLSSRQDFLQFVVFEPRLKGRDIFSIFSMQINRNYKLSHRGAQLFLPSVDKFD